MRLTSKSFVVALSALFAVTPVVPVEAAPMPVVNVQLADAGGGVQLIRDRDPRWLLRKQRRGYSGHAGKMDWYGDGAQRSQMRQGRQWRQGSRDGWYRGHRGYRHHRPGYRYHNGFWFPLAAFGVGTIIGGAIANDGGYTGGGSHVNWCANRYRSYRAYDNTYQPYNGPRRQCVSPYR